METRAVLLKADKVSVVFERGAFGEIRVTTSSWDDAIDDTGSSERVTVRKRDASQRDVTT